ncbi:hypothetical protein RJ639_042779 [Escallonia herrerae]|uniref:Gnk2-homologous domain-containing protein n=1 Tax=Escallonia herrerae TaxID=1293975 RepID=A0AA88WC72_9ASTE|nr:hypothetical protein RJ639_042779 [Escallonia herrerae]
MSPLYLILTLLTISSPATAEPHFTYCPPKLNYTVNSPFENNLKTLLDSLSYSTSLNKGFNNTSVGDGSDQVYGQALCRGDVTPEVCRKCVQNVSKDILEECQSKDAIMWHELCQIQYSYQKFFSLDVYTGKYPDWNKAEKDVPDQAHFQTVLSLMKTLSEKAAQDASSLMFATGKKEFSKAETIFGLVQCTRDMSSNGCRSCFTKSLGDLRACCQYRQGGTVFSRNCNVRFQTYPFYGQAEAIFSIIVRGRGEKQLSCPFKMRRKANVNSHPTWLCQLAWQLWNEGQEFECVDPLLTESCAPAEVLKCIHIGLLCVQEDPAERPTMSNVVALLGSESVALPQPSRPAFSVGRIAPRIDLSLPSDPSINQVTVSSILLR